MGALKVKLKKLTKIIINNKKTEKNSFFGKKNTFFGNFKIPY